MLFPMVHLGLVENVLGSGLVLAGLAAWGIGPAYPVTMSLDHLICGFAGLLLAQGLVRDLWVLRTRGKICLIPRPATEETRTLGPSFNLCLESTVGSLFLGLVILYSLVPREAEFQVPLGLLLAGAGLVLIAGWQGRDWVLTLHQVPNHYDLPVWRPSQRVKLPEPSPGEQPPAS